MKMNICKIIYALLCDIRAEYTFKVKGYTVTATFTEKPNPDILPRLREILLGDSHIRQVSPAPCKMEKKPKEAV